MDVKKDCRIISRARVIMGAEALEAMRKADAKKNSSAKTFQSNPTTLHPTRQSTGRLQSTPGTHSTIHVTPFTPRVWCNLSTPLVQPLPLLRPRPCSIQQSEWDSETSSEDDGSLNSHQSDTEDSTISGPSSVIPAPDLHPISERVHQMSLRTCRG